LRSTADVFFEIILTAIIEIGCHRDLESLRETRPIAATHFAA
jgi:hypothetical protein